MAVLYGCIDAPPAAVDGGNAAATLSLQALDARGFPSSVDQLPRSPRLIVDTTGGFDPGGPGLLLFQGQPDSALLSDLERLPLTATSERRLVASRVACAPDRATLSPELPLARGSAYTLALPHTALSSQLRAVWPDGWTQRLTVEDSAAAGARLLASFPEPEARDVPTDLHFALLAFDGEVSGVTDGIWLEDAAGLAVPATVDLVACSDIESDAVRCARVTPLQPLAASARYLLRSGRALRDAHAAEIVAVVVPFTTATAGAPALAGWGAQQDCARDELALEAGCVLLGDDQLSLHVQPLGTARLRARIAGQALAHLPQAASATFGFTGLQPDTPYTLSIEQSDAQDATQRRDFELRTLSRLATLSITEVRADPLGPEPAQEYVELLNFGPEAIALAGLTLSDAVGEVGIRVDAAVTLPPAARALLVADAYDRDDTLDVMPPAAAMLVRVGAALTRSGLANRGAPLFLRDAQGHRLSAVPAKPTPVPGVCITRISDDPRSGAADSFDYDPDGSCTPGY